MKHPDVLFYLEGGDPAVLAVALFGFETLIGQSE